MTDASELAAHLRFANGGRMITPVERRHATRVIDSHELILVERGTLPMFQGEESYRVGSGEYLVLTRGQRHGGSADYPRDLRFTWLHFHCPPSLLALPAHGALARPRVAAELGSRLLDEQDRPDAPPGSCDLLMVLLLLECTAARPAEGGDPSGLAERARQQIALRHREPVGPAEIAAGCGCSPDHLGRLFRARFGIPMGAALQAERIASAKALLRDEALTVAAIAERCGFSDAHYLRRIFKRATGLSPSGWRRLHLRQRINVR